MSYINKTDAINELLSKGHSDAAKTLWDFPSAAVEEVIRCKDCKYGVRPVLSSQMKCNKDGERWVFFDGYCDLAERREE